MNGIKVAGRVSFAGDGTVNLQLKKTCVPSVRVSAPADPGQSVPAQMSRPDVDDVQKKILDEQWNVHPSRFPLTPSVVKIAISNIQHRPDLTLQTGRFGDWSENAWVMLKDLFESPKRQRTKKKEPIVLALPAPAPLLALPAPAPEPEADVPISELVVPGPGPEAEAEEAPNSDSEPEAEGEKAPASNSNSDSDSDSSSESKSLRRCREVYIYIYIYIY